MKKIIKPIADYIIKYYIITMMNKTKNGVLKMKTSLKTQSAKYTMTRVDADRYHRLSVSSNILLAMRYLTAADRARLIEISAELTSIKTKYRAI